MLKKQFPDLAPLLLQPGLQYFNPQFLTEETERHLLRQPYQLSTFLPTGGLLTIPSSEPFNYGYEIGYSIINQARETYESTENGENDEEGDRLSQRGNDIINTYRHMLM